uniref:DNA polymerase zeta processivity subunit n=1 Tax=Erigeron canadensis TaxID=72917 RepID=UPI001CB96EEC|nr:DNA polymerase zeta processivity subunit [Erigeron canadensis]XP_043636093.1 DNA polymerase zeta processivity subunit [Erigeron canadensis]
MGGETELVVEFLEIAITSVVFLKGIYPAGAFERGRYMNILVHKARHPQLKHYIHHSLNQLVPHFQQGLVERIAVIFFSDEKIPMEKFLFKIDMNHSNKSYEQMMEHAELELSLRSFLIKLSQSEPLFKTVVSQDLRWEITAYFSSPPGDNVDMWVPTHIKQWKQPPIITPIKSMNIEPLSVQLYIEHPTVLET